MKKSIYLLVVCSSILFLGCKKNPDDNLSGTYSLKLDESRNMPENGKAGLLSLVELQDNRCPENIFCLTSGMSFLKIKLIDQKKQQVLQFCFDVCDRRDQVVRLNGTYYTIRLENVLPLPPGGSATHRPTATFTISKIE
ncbi:MAG: hypothetical protein REI78_12225 [Pedobacter sp.]|nr:hypothetical protein [Pedobacter sp.]MDQ8053790.1 hypothetical protein [Pedobacter sp.]